jgi:hypothetical protein
VLLDRVSMELHVAGFPDLALETRLVRRQLATQYGRCALRFIDPSEEQRRILGEMIGADHTPAPERRRALLVHAEQAHVPALAADVAALGFAVRSETSTGQAAAWLQRQSADLLLVEHRVVEKDRFGLLQFARDTVPEMRRFVLAPDVRGFRLYFAIKAGLVDGLVEPAMPRDLLARHLLSDSRAGAGERDSR